MTAYVARGHPGVDAGNERRNVSDVVGVMVLGACATWALVTGALCEGRPEGVLLAVLAVAAGYACGRIAGALLPVAAPGAGALAGAAVVVIVPGLTAGPRFDPPLGHVGATAAVLTLAEGAACCAAWAASAPALRLGLRVLAVAVAGTAAVLGSESAVVCCAGVLLASLAAGRLRHRGAGLAGLALVPVLVAGVSWALAAHALPGGPARVLADWLTAHRTGLWRDALRLAHHHPVLGVGPGRFAEFSPTAARSPQPEGTPHSALFQQAAEQGLVGVVLQAAACLWVGHALWRSARPTPVVLTAGAALAAVASVAVLGDALSFTAVSVGAGLLAGAATARPLAEETGVTGTTWPGTG
ncbi:O-antigen ligase family protein [Streptomyces mexicanus]|uniref:O-antigen ligase family protein n=1 Tax=Streptomyces mexicanus TaxID=178566 RepID=UPI0036633D71